jgi:hypothetical protein
MKELLQIIYARFLTLTPYNFDLTIPQHIAGNMVDVNAIDYTRNIILSILIRAAHVVWKNSARGYWNLGRKLNPEFQEEILRSSPSSTDFCSTKECVAN